MSSLYKIIILIIMVSPVRDYAQGFQVNLQGQKQQGMGGAGTAFMQDASSLFFNPGGASFVHGTQFNLGVTPTFARGAFMDDKTHEVSRTNSPVSTPFAAYGMFELKDSSKLKLGLAVYTPFGSTVQWEDNWTGRFALTRLELRAIFIQPTVSYKLTKNLGIGAGFVYATGKVNLQKDIPLVDANGNYGHAELSGKAHGYGFNVGVYFKPIEKLSIGLTYRSKVNMAVNDGQANFDVPEGVSANFPDGKFKSKLPLPSVLSLGMAYKANSKLDFALDINYVGWKAYDTLSFDYENNTASLIDTKSARMYKNTFAFRGGAQYKVTEHFAARLGLAYGITPVQDGYVTPETPDANRVNYTAGIGYEIGKHLKLDASFLFTHLERSGTNKETNLSGTFKTNVCAPGISIGYKF
ncbi:MAG: rane protein involved in aromatic hydrocarbon degradation [Bacteroidetes bacterium]|nr:rane protein involved in aromatic hydrocarbon degradation [Bacteroidota bacterium]